MFTYSPRRWKELNLSMNKKEKSGSIEGPLNKKYYFPISVKKFKINFLEITLIKYIFWLGKAVP